MKKALIRLEDVGPGGSYASSLNLKKLKAVLDYLISEDVHFQVSMIPRFINPATNYNKSIADTSDPYIIEFNKLFDDIAKTTAHMTLGMHGYTHQYGQSESAKGYEFYYPNCTQNCPPDDPPEACRDYNAFVNSYAYSRMLLGYDTFVKSGLTIDWGYSTPHYQATGTQRCILQAWSGLFFEVDPLNPSKRTLTIEDVDDEFYTGVIYVPTTLGYVVGSDPNASVIRICQALDTYTEKDLAAFYYHPYLEFPFIQITESGDVIYDDNSYLKRLINCFKSKEFTFVPLTSLINFVPASRQTNFFPGNEHIFFTGNIKDEHNHSITNLIIWKPDIGYWYYAKGNLENFPSRQFDIGAFTTYLALFDWAKGRQYIPKIGDFNGDGNDDIVVWNPSTGDWQVALSDGLQFFPSKFSILKPWAVGSYWVPLIGDFNGDGKDDIVVWNPNTGDWQVALSDGSKFVPNGTWLKPWAVGSYWVPLIGDFNGDGKDDIVVWNPNNGNWQVALSDGSKFVPNGTWLNNWAKTTYWTPLVADFDGDGKSDILVAGTTKGDWQVALSDGSKFIPHNSPFAPWAAGNDMQPFVGDWNGDGRYGILARHPLLRNGTIDVAISLLNPTNVDIHR